MKRICVYCGSSDRIRDDYRTAAQTVGAAIARRKAGLVYGGGRTGVMGAVAQGALAAGGEVIGVIPQFLNSEVLAHRGLTRLEEVPTMHERKARFVELSDAFIVLPGGYGTFDEFFEILAWAQLGLHRKPIGLFNVRRYFDPLLAMLEHAAAEGFIYEEHHGLYCHAEDAEELLDLLAAYGPPGNLAAWLTRDKI